MRITHVTNSYFTPSRLTESFNRLKENENCFLAATLITFTYKNMSKLPHRVNKI